MKNKISNYLIVIIYVVLVTGLIFCALENIISPWKSVYISLGIITSFTLKQLLTQLEYSKKVVFYLLIIIDIILTVYLSISASGTSFRIFYYVIMYEVIFSFEKIKAAITCIGFYILDITVNYIKIGKFDTVAFLKYELYNFPQYILIAVVLFLVKYIIDINAALSISQSRLEVSNIQLEDTYNNLKKAYRKNEQYLIMEGKNKLAREIHDTVGHTLTTALVEMEASKILMDNHISKTDDISRNQSDLQKSSQKLNASIQQVRKGLNDVRHSVSALSIKNTDYYKEITDLIQDVRKHTDVVIRYDIDDISRENENLKKCIYRALQEGITNSIKHGSATAIVFKLKYIENFLLFSLEDNGKGCSFYKKGFGLSAMEERVKDAFGEIDMMTQPGDGFNIYIKFHKINNEHSI